MSCELYSNDHALKKFKTTNKDRHTY